MIKRYTRREMGAVWSDESRFSEMLKVEVAVCRVLAAEGYIPKEAFKRIEKNAGFSMKEIEKNEKKVKHDVIAFLTSVAKRTGRDSVYIHHGLTSSDVLDTALALQLKKASEILEEDLKILVSVLKKKTKKYKDTLMPGRTHGIHAEPITLGFKIAGWYSEMKRNLERMKTAGSEVSFGKISGVVGTSAHLPFGIEEKVLKTIGLKTETVSTQIVPRDRHAAYLCALSVIAASIERIAGEIRALQRTEISELAEPFAEGQKGSSAMPHKRNPVTCEKLCGLARVVRANAQSALENVALWNERDISHSSVERIILPDSTILLDYMLTELSGLISGLEVYPENMKRNLGLTSGAMFSQKLLLLLVKKGCLREAAYPVVQALSQRAISTGTDFYKLAAEDEFLEKYLSAGELKSCFDITEFTKNIGRILRRAGIY